MLVARRMVNILEDYVGLVEPLTNIAFVDLDVLEQIAALMNQR